MANMILHTKAQVISKGIDESEGILDAVVGSSNVLDRLGDIIDQSGWKLQNYKKTNPVVLWGHNIKEERPPIGKALKVWVQDKGTKIAKLMFKVKFDLQDDFAKEIFRKIKDGFINTVSVGFLPLEWEEIHPDEMFGGRKYTKQELLELSFVPVPANPEALVALKGMKDRRFNPVDYKDIYPDQSKVEPVEKPYPNEHACRLRNPDDFKEGSFRSQKRTHDGKDYRVIMGRLKGETTMTDQAYRYKKDIWSKGEAGTHCKGHGGSFEPATEEDQLDFFLLNGKKYILMDKPKEGTEEKPKEDVKGDEPVTEKPKEPEAPKEPETPKEGVPETPPVEPAKDTEEDVKPEPEETPPVEEKPTEEKPVEEKPKEEEDKPKVEPQKPEPQKPEPPMESKGVIPFKDLGTAPESEGWDGGGETKKAEVDDLKLMCAWFDSDAPDNKGSYKLPHHKAVGHKCVWRGTAAAMAALLGARGGVDIPDSDRKGVYNHLTKHYKQFDKEIPDFKMVEEQILKHFDEEIHALILDREDRYTVRLIKKILKTQRKVKEEKITLPTTKQLESALKVIDTALSLYQKGSLKGGGKEG